MRVTWVDLLKYAGFRNQRVVAGSDGLNRHVRFVSVYDCVRSKEFRADESDTLYLTTLGQFENNRRAILPWIKHLNGNNVSGLCILSDGTELLTDGIIRYCDENGFPIISIDKDQPYSEIIDNISALLQFNDLHAVNAKKIERVISNKMSPAETARALEDINPYWGKNIIVLSITGNFVSHIDVKKMNKLFDDSKENMYVRFNEKHFIVMSGDDPSKLSRAAASVRNLTKQFFIDCRAGETKIYGLRDFAKAFANAERALNIAIMNGTGHVVYDNFSDAALLLPLKDSEEAKDFYEKFKAPLVRDDPRDKMKYLDCVREYVRSKGDWSVVAKTLLQSENTIRYRMNKIKTLLGFSDDSIKFHEIISLFVLLEKISGDRFS